MARDARPRFGEDGPASGVLPTFLKCRRRNITNLSPDHARLAQGHISPQLKRASPVYFWRHTRQRHSRYEAICEKPQRSKWHILTFGSHARFKFLAEQRCQLARRGFTHRVRTPLADTCQNHTLASLPEEWRVANGIEQTTRGAGWWKWKPYLLQQRLREVADGDVILWADYDLLLAQSESIAHRGT